MPEPTELEVFAARLNSLGTAYMITGATAAIVYGQPRVTNDLDLVIALKASDLPRLSAAFPDSEFYLPPQAVLRVEQARRQRGHFNILHFASGYKADVYLAGQDPLHAWALPRRRLIPWTDSLDLPVAPPEYVILRKLEYYREGGSTKHVSDIRAMLAAVAIDRAEIDRWAAALGLEATLKSVFDEDG